MNADLLLEIGTEEVPARFMTWGLAELKRLAEEEFAAVRIRYESLRTIGTPRRTVLVVKGLAERQDDFEETFKGPPVSQARNKEGQFTPAALGFARSRGVEVEELSIQEVKGVQYLFATVKEPGRETTELLPELLSGLIKKLAYPKSMYWTDDPTLRFARPVRWLLALWGDRQIPVSFGAVKSGEKTRGHRFLGQGLVEIRDAAQYEPALERECVIVDQEVRREMILSQIAKIEQETGDKCEVTPELLEENVQLVEYPVLFRGSFDESFLDIPEEVLIATMVKNQRYFPMRDARGRLAASFIGVAGNRAKDMNVVREGNERVLRARFCDAAFFWNEDRKVTLESRLPSLSKILYQEKIGSMLDKVKRTGELAHNLAKTLLPDALADVDRAALLSKADLVTGMVFEFPEVQGVMGREYARREGENEAVALALFEQYLPRNAGDALPSSKVGAIIGLCDRVDTIIAIHKAGLPPTGSQDPYGLRRAARCINELIWGLQLDVDLGELFKAAAEGLAASGDDLEAAKAFYSQRLYNQLRERGHSHGTTSLVVASMGHRPLQALRMLEEFDKSSGKEWFASLITSAIRVNNILSKLPDEERLSLGKQVRTLSLPEEHALAEALASQGGVVAQALESCDWGAVCAALAELSQPVSSFFDAVMVMDENPQLRRSRLSLLEEARNLFDSIGDFSLLKA